MTIKLYELCGADTNHVFSPHCWKTRMCLAHKGLNFESVATPFTGVATIEGGEGRRVPVLRDGETVIEDSMEIARYLEKTYPDAPSLFQGKGGDALTVFIANWSLATLHPEVAKVAILDIYNSIAPEDQVHFRKTREAMFGCTLEEFSAKFPKDGKSMAAALKPVEAVLASQPYLGGDSPLYADYAVFGALQWARVCATADVLPKEGPVAVWFNNLLDMYDGMARNAKAAA